MALADALGCTWYMLFLFSPLSNFRSGADSIWLVSPAPRFLSQGSRQRQLQIVAPVQKTQKTLATTPFPQRMQTMTLPLIPWRRHHPIRIRWATSISRPSQTSMFNCATDGVPTRTTFLPFWDAIRAAYLCSPSQNQKRGAATGTAEMDDAMTAHRCGGTQVTRRPCA